MIRPFSIAVLAIGASALASLAVADPAPATTATTVSPATVTSAAKPAKKVHDPNEVICKTIPEPGSRLGGARNCMTRADWEQQGRDSAHAMSNFQASHTSTGMGSK